MEEGVAFPCMEAGVAFPCMEAGVAVPFMAAGVKFLVWLQKVSPFRPTPNLAQPIPSLKPWHRLTRHVRDARETAHPGKELGSWDRRFHPRRRATWVGLSSCAATASAWAGRCSRCPIAAASTAAGSDMDPTPACMTWAAAASNRDLTYLRRARHYHVWVESSAVAVSKPLPFCRRTASSPMRSHEITRSHVGKQTRVTCM